jgi:N-acetylglucosamine-6-phosphate deacetylase
MAQASSFSVSARTVLGAFGAVSPGTVTVAGGVVHELGPLSGASPEFEILAPGFVDLQCNGAGSVDVASAEGSDWQVIAAELVSHGVTTWCPTLVTAPDEDTAASVARIGAARKAAGPGSPEIAGAHLEGPYITVFGAHRAEHARSSVEASFAESLDPCVRIVTLAPELPGAMQAITALAANAVVVSLGHSGCSAEQAHEAASAGARLVTHLGNATGVFHQRSPGLFGAALADERLAVGLIADLEHVHADVLRMAFQSKGADGVVLVSDSVAVSAGTVGPVEFGHHGVHRAARLADGTLAGSALTMERAVDNCVSAAGVRVEDALKAASTTPARILGMTDRGAIAPGLRADLVALGTGAGHLSVDAVWIAGELAWRNENTVSAG